MRVIALFGRGYIGKTHCLGHLINLIYRETKGYDYLVEGENARVTLDYLGHRVTICTWGDNYDEEDKNVKKIQSDNPDVAIVATRTKQSTVKILEEFCLQKGYGKPKWVEKYVASFDDKSGQEYLNNLQAEQILDYVRGLIKGQLYYVDSISSISEDKERYHVSLIGAEMSNDGFPRTLSLELNANQLNYYESKLRVMEDDFVLYRPDSDNQLRYGNEEPLARTLRNESVDLRRNLTEYEIYDDAVYAFKHMKSNILKSYHVKVGHGNCSLILSVYDNDYELWMVDCSTYDYLIRRDYSKDLHLCLSDIANILGIKMSEIRISRFMLTHTHFDHYNGLLYVINNGYIDAKTIVYANLYYECASPIWINILKELQRLKCRFVEPICYKKDMGAISIYHPECRLLKKESIHSGLKYRIVQEVNNSSVVYGIKLGDRIMVFPGDLEGKGFENMSSAGCCSSDLFRCDYYVISHHGSINGHPVMPCMNPAKPMPSPLTCASHHLSKAILMGRNGAYSGIYSSVVIDYWNRQTCRLECVEKSRHYIELDWKTGKVKSY